MPNHPLLETKVLTELVRKFPDPEFPLSTKVFPSVNTAAWHAEWDVFDYSRKVAPLSGRGREGVFRAKSERSRFIADYLHTRVKDIALGVDMQSLLKPGASSYDQAWGQQLVTDTLEDLVRQCKYSLEYTCAKLLEGGQASLTFDGVTITVGDQFRSSHRASAAATWATTTNNIISDVEAWKKLIKQDAGLVADFILMDEVAHGYVINNGTIQNYMKETGDVDSIIKDGKVNRLLGLDVIVYDDVYASETGDPIDFWTTGYVLVGCYAPKAMTKTLVGPVEDPESGGSPGLFSKSWQNNDPAGVNVLVDFNFMPIIPIPDAFVYGDVVV